MGSKELVFAGPMAEGLTKRELFAAMAMQGLMANPGGPYQASVSSGWVRVNCTQKQIAQECADMADALLAALSEPQAPELLAVARYAVDNPDFDSAELDRMARAAIAKATGGEQ